MYVLTAIVLFTAKTVWCSIVSSEKKTDFIDFKANIQVVALSNWANLIAFKHIN